jgi:hypothetical protein
VQPCSYPNCHSDAERRTMVICETTVHPMETFNGACHR